MESCTDLTPGDLYMHFLPGDIQIWIWLEDSAGILRWKSIKVGYTRSDGQRLRITDIRRNPSWVSDRWFGIQQTKQPQTGQAKKQKSKKKK